MLTINTRSFKHPLMELKWILILGAERSTVCDCLGSRDLSFVSNVYIQK